MTPGEESQPEAPRLTPYELVFGAPAFEEERFPAIREEMLARARGGDDPETFVMLGSVGALLRALTPDASEADGGRAPDEPGAPGPSPDRRASLLAQARLLYHAYRFWAAGRPFLFLQRPAARFLVEGRPGPAEWRLRLPAEAGYLQLPRHLFWTRIDEDAAAEPIDGFFWALGGGSGAMEHTAFPDEPLTPGPGRAVHLLLAAGMRPGRPGFASIPVDGRPPDAATPDWSERLEVDGRRELDNILPGGELEGLYGMRTGEEALKLASLCFWYATEHRTLDISTPAPGSGFRMPASALPARHLSLTTDGPRG